MSDNHQPRSYEHGTELDSIERRRAVYPRGRYNLQVVMQATRPELFIAPAGSPDLSDHYEARSYTPQNVEPPEAPAEMPTMPEPSAKVITFPGAREGDEELRALEQAAREAVKKEAA